MWPKLGNQPGMCRRKLHVVVDASTGEIVATDLTGRRTRDCARVPVLFGQINDPVASVVADGAYDALVVYEAGRSRANSPGSAPASP